MTTFDKWDLVLVPFPFTDLSSTKKRPALVVSPMVYNKTGDVVIAFITSNLGVPGQIWRLYTFGLATSRAALAKQAQDEVCHRQLGNSEPKVGPYTVS